MRVCMNYMSLHSNFHGLSEQNMTCFDSGPIISSYLQKFNLLLLQPIHSPFGNFKHSMLGCWLTANKPVR